MNHQIDQTILIPKKQVKYRLRDQIFLAWGWCCAYCGSMLGEKDATLDHVLAKKKGGLTIKKNLVACCFGCNSGKSATDWKQWFRSRPYWSEVRERWIEEWLEQ